MTPSTIRPIVLLAIAAALALSLSLATSWSAAATTTESSMSASILGWLNHDRTDRGLRPLRIDLELSTLAATRAANLSRAATFSHEAAGGDLAAALDARSIQWYGYGEAIAWTSYPWGASAASWIYRSWMASAGHRSILMSRDVNYLGLGLARRPSNGTTFASLVTTDSRDHSGAIAVMTSAQRSGHRIVFRWRGGDLRLQVRTAGLRNFDVEYRVDGGAWRRVANATTATWRTLLNRASGHWHSLRVRARDRNGNVGRWSLPYRVYVP